MRIVTAGAGARRPDIHRPPDPRQHRRARLECLAMVIVTLVVLVGAWVTYRQQMSALGGVAADMGRGAIVEPGIGSAASLSTVLTVFPSAAERTFAATTIGDWIAAHGRLTHVGDLARIAVPAATIAADPQLPTLAERARRTSRSPVPLFTSGDLAAIKPALIVRTPPEYQRTTAITVVLFLAAFWLAHVARRLFGTTGDAVMLPAIQLLAGLGLLMMMSLRDPLRDTDAAWSVAVGVAIACAALVAVSLVDFENPRFRFATGVPLAAAVSLAVLLIAFGSGPGASGVKVNLWGAQPVEAIRLLAVLALASYFSRRWETLRELSDSVAGTPLLRLPRWRDVSALVVIVGTLLVFFFLQRDLGPALVLGCLSLALYGVARGRSTLVLCGLLVLLAGFTIGYALGIPATVARRVAIWIDPWNNGLIGGDQIAHGLWALATGATDGLGLARGDGPLVPAGHTDLIVAVLGEQIGLVGVVTIAALYVLLIWRMLRIAVRAPGDYTMFLALGCALSLAVPAVVIVGGVLGLLPLSGVVTPFLSFGKSSMISNFIAVGIVMAIAQRSGTVRPRCARQVRTLATVLAAAALLLVVDAARIQAWSADATAVRPTLVEQADGVVRYQYNPRLVMAARRIPRGTIYDRHGMALATSDAALARQAVERLQQAGAPVSACAPAPARCYPLGGRGFHLLGDWNEQTNWTASNASFIERDDNVTLQGFDDHARLVRRALHGGAEQTRIVRDYRELLPLVRHKDDPNDSDVRRLLGRSRDVTTSIDGVLQALASKALEARVKSAGAARGAAVVIDPDTGELLAAASYPYPGLDASNGADPSRVSAALLDRARYGLYPPGSTFKLITAAAALRMPGGDGQRFICARLPDGRAGAKIHGFAYPVRDDVLDREPHGVVDLHRGLVVSCNAYFAQLAVRVGSQAIIDAAAATGIRVASPPVSTHLQRTLPYAGYGQGEVVATPLRMARVAGAIASEGLIRETTITRVGDAVRTSSSEEAGAVRWLTTQQASFLAGSMRDVVREGTGRVLAGHRVSIAGKTGTAEVSGQPSHSWFIGFAPYTAASHRIAFAVIVENAGYGSRVAAPLAGDLVSAASAAGVIR